MAQKGLWVLQRYFLDNCFIWTTLYTVQSTNYLLFILFMVLWYFPHSQMSRLPETPDRHIADSILDLNLSHKSFTFIIYAGKFLTLPSWQNQKCLAARSEHFTVRQFNLSSIFRLVNISRLVSCDCLLQLKVVHRGYTSKAKCKHIYLM